MYYILEAYLRGRSRTRRPRAKKKKLLYFAIKGQTIRVDCPKCEEKKALRLV